MTTLPVPGQRLGHRFTIERRISEGGMGVVFRARDDETGRPVAVKVLSESQDVERFAREADTLAELRHAHVVSYVAHGTSDTGHPYLVMEWLEGEDLAQHLSKRRIGVAGSMALLRGASEALAEAHARGIVHRDIKPSNLFLRDCEPESVTLVDFGIARRMLRPGALTRTGAVLGTPQYMAPEQARGGRSVGPPADVFALGCVLFECLAGRPPFIGEHVAAILFKVVFDEPPAISLLCPNTPSALAELLQRMLSKDPAARFANGQALLDAVRRLPPAEEQSIAPTMVGPSSLAALAPDEQQIFSIAVAVPWPGSDEQPRDSDGVRAALTELGAGVELLADGSVVATVFPSESAADQALVAARCGLLMKRRLANVEVAVATGRGTLLDQRPVGEAIDRAMTLLAGRGRVDTNEAAPTERAGGGVWLDDLSENLLAGRLQIARMDGRVCVVGERDPGTYDDVRRLLGQPTPCVGREQELGTLEAALASCIADSVSRAIGVVAPPGMGKSRLRHELIRAAAQRHPELVILLGRGDLMSAGSPYGILGQAIRRLCELGGGEPPAIQQERLQARARRHLPANVADRVACFLGELCGVHFPSEGSSALKAARGDPKVMHDHVTLAFLEWMRAECEAAPILLVLEDLHWGDALTVQLLEQVLRELSELPLLILALGRPEVQDLFPSFWNARCLQELPLRGLSRRASERFASEVLKQALGSSVETETVSRIVTQAAGNPLFLEELIRAVAEGRGDAMPETVLAMLVARLSQLDPGARHALRVASVFGETFTRDGVAALLGGSTAEGSVDGALAALVRAENIERRREAGLERYKFRHALVRDAAYSLLTDEDRALAHRLAGRHLEQTGDVEPAVLAEHALEGRELDRAAHFFIEAAEQALRSCDLAATQRHAERAFNCGVEGEQRGIVRALGAWAAYFKLDMEAGYSQALEAVDALRPGSFWWTKSIGVCFYAFFLIYRVEHAERLIGAFMMATPDPDARIAYLDAGTTLCTFFVNAGMRGAGRALIDKLTTVAAELPPRDHGYLLLADSWYSYYLEPDPFRALDDARRAYALFLDDGDRRSQVNSMFARGMAYTALGAFTEGEQSLRDALALAQLLQEHFWIAVLQIHLGFNLAAQPAPPKQGEAGGIGAACKDLEQLGPALRGAAHAILGQVLMNGGDLAAAEPVLKIALEFFSRMLPYRLAAVALYVDLLLAQGRTAEGRQAAEEALRQIDEQGGLGYCEVPARLAVALARSADGDKDGAHRALDDAQAQVKLRAERIREPGLRQSFLELPENRRIAAAASPAGFEPA